MYQFLLYSKMTQLYTLHTHIQTHTHTHTHHTPHIYTFFFILFSIMVYLKRLDIVPCAIQYKLFVYSF